MDSSCGFELRAGDAVGDATSASATALVVAAVAVPRVVAASIELVDASSCDASMPPAAVAADAGAGAEAGSAIGAFAALSDSSFDASGPPPLLPAWSVATVGGKLASCVCCMIASLGDVSSLSWFDGVGGESPCWRLLAH